MRLQERSLVIAVALLAGCTSASGAGDDAGLDGTVSDGGAEAPEDAAPPKDSASAAGDDTGPVEASCGDTQTDPSNCGACGNACGPHGTCLMGTCSCVTGFSLCPSADAGAQCIPLGTCCRPSDCGDGGTICPSPGMTCSCAPGARICPDSGVCAGANDCCDDSDCAVVPTAVCDKPGQPCVCYQGQTGCIASRTCVPPGNPCP